MDWAKDTAINVTFEAAYSIDQRRIANQHAQTKARHIICFAQRVQFYRHLVCTRHFQNTHRTKIVKIDFGISHIVNDGDIMAARKFNGSLKKGAVGAGRSRIIGIIEPEYPGLCQHIWRNARKVGQVVVLLQQWQQIRLRSHTGSCREIDRVVGIGRQSYIACIQYRSSCIDQSLFRAQQGQNIALRREANAKTLLEPVGNSFVEGAHAAILGIAMILGLLHCLAEPIHHCLRCGQIRVSHRETDHIHSGSDAVGYFLLCIGKVEWWHSSDEMR